MKKHDDSPDYRPSRPADQSRPPAGPGGPGMTRRQLTRHAGWFGSALALTIVGGEVVSKLALGEGDAPTPAAAAGPNALRFVQVSDSHIGFTGAANTDVTASFDHAIEQINTLGYRPDFVMHTGDLTHLSLPQQFDQAHQMMTGLATDRVFTVPGEHDSIDDQGAAYRKTFGRGSLGEGWYSFDTHGVHFIALVNTLSLEDLGHLGADQIEFVRHDVAGLGSDTPLVLFSHIPLFAMYPAWGWTTDDAVQVLALLKRFASVTCLNGHVHQLFSRVEGNVTFHSATTTAYPLPKPGAAREPAPLVLPARRLQAALGIRTVEYRETGAALAITDQRLA